MSIMGSAAAAGETAPAGLAASSRHGDGLEAHGRFQVEHRNADGVLLWQDEFPNLITTLGKNGLLDAYLSGSGYSVVGPYMGLISSVSWSAVAAGDTMASHAGWTEAGATNAPTFTARLTCAWNPAAAGVKQLSAGLTFTFTSAGTVEGAFLVLGPLDEFLRVRRIDLDCGQDGCSVFRCRLDRPPRRRLVAVQQRQQIACRDAANAGVRVRGVSPVVREGGRGYVGHRQISLICSE